MTCRSAAIGAIEPQDLLPLWQHLVDGIGLDSFARATPQAPTEIGVGDQASDRRRQCLGIVDGNHEAGDIVLDDLQRAGAERLAE